MSAPPTGHYWGRCDACGKATARPYRTVWVACWRASCHPPIDRRTP